MNFNSVSRFVKRAAGISRYSYVFFSSLIFLFVFESWQIANSQDRSEMLTAKAYSLSTPLVLSQKPLVRLEKALVNFSSSLEASSSDTYPALPNQWGALGLLKNTKEISLHQAVLTLDLSGKPSSALLQDLLLKSVLGEGFLKHGISKVTFKDSRIHIIKAIGSPLVIPLKDAVFDLDLDDQEIEGKGEIELAGRLTKFHLETAGKFVSSSGSKPSSIKLTLENNILRFFYDGNIDGKDGIGLDGQLSFKFSEFPKLRSLIDAHLFPANESEENLLSKKNGKSSSRSFSQAVIFSGQGHLTWSGLGGSLSNADFLFGRNKAGGSLSLKLTDHNHLVSGSLAFQDLDLSDIFKTTGARQDDDNRSNKALGLRLNSEFLEIAIKKISPLIKALDVDLRLSAQTLKLDNMTFKEPAFSLYQQKGTFILDIAETPMFGGQASGHVKIDTNYPKPRWHINTRFHNVDIGDCLDNLDFAPLLKGRGTIDIKLVSFGDKVSEMQQNLSGDMTVEMKEGGELGLNLTTFDIPETDAAILLKNLTSGKTNFQSLSFKNHFSKGKMITDHMIIDSPMNTYTANGHFGLETAELTWYIGTWKILKTEKVASRQPAEVKGTSGKRLNCTQVTGTLDNFVFDDQSSAPLSSLKENCSAPFYLKTLKRDF